MKSRIEHFTIRINEVDHRGQLTLPALVNLLQEIAWNHARQLGVSVHQLLEKDLTWVLVGLEIELNKIPGHGEVLTIETWPSGMEKLLVFRDFALRQDEHQIGRVLSSWLVFDVKKRSWVKVPDFIAKTVSTEYPETRRVNRKMVRPSQFTYQHQFNVRLLETDVNRHVNNAAYVQWIVETVPPEFLEAHRIRKLEINFKAESVLGDKILSRSFLGTEKTFLHEILNQDDKELVRARTVWV